MISRRFRGDLWGQAPPCGGHVAGTDPTNVLSKFAAKIEMKDGAPVVTWSPALNGDGVREGSRTYRVWGKANPGDEGDFRFFRVTVEMP